MCRFAAEQKLLARNLLTNGVKAKEGLVGIALKLIYHFACIFLQSQKFRTKRLVVEDLTLEIVTWYHQN